MLQAFTYDVDGVRTTDPQSISEQVLRDGVLVWVDVTDPTDADMLMVQQEFGLHPLAIEDVQKHGQRPKLEHYPDHSFLVAYAVTSDVLSLAEVDVFVGPNWLVTVRERSTRGDVFDLTESRARFERTRAGAQPVGLLLYTIVDEIVDDYFIAVDLIEDELEVVESSIWESNSGATERRLQANLLRLRRELVLFRRQVAPLREALLAVLRGEVEWVDGAQHLYFQDVFDHLLRINDQIDNLRELVGNAVDAHLAVVANRTNDIMKKVTSWGAILIVANIVTGVYGMNFKFLPGQEVEHGFFFALLFMLVMTVGLYLYFRQKDWL